MNILEKSNDKIRPYLILMFFCASFFALLISQFVPGIYFRFVDSDFVESFFFGHTWTLFFTVITLFWLYGFHKLDKSFFQVKNLVRFYIIFYLIRFLTIIILFVIFRFSWLDLSLYKDHLFFPIFFIYFYYFFYPNSRIIPKTENAANKLLLLILLIIQISTFGYEVFKGVSRYDINIVEEFIGEYKFENVKKFIKNNSEITSIVGEVKKVVILNRSNIIRFFNFDYESYEITYKVEGSLSGAYVTIKSDECSIISDRCRNFLINIKK